MGTGLHGGFGNTSGAKKSKLFTPVQFEGTVKVNGETRDVSRKIYQRHDIDFNYFDENTGMTNLERMRSGKAPIGNVETRFNCTMSSRGKPDRWLKSVRLRIRNTTAFYMDLYQVEQVSGMIR